MTTESHLNTSMNITLHLPTAAITVAIGSLALFGMSASAPQSPTNDRDVQAVEDIGSPVPEDLVWLYCADQPSTYTVPQGRVLVLNCLQGNQSYAHISIDGGTPRQVHYSYNGLGNGFTLTEGQTITVSAFSGDIHSFFGYLVDA